MSPSDRGQANPLTPDEITRVRKVAFERGKAIGLARDQAGLLADAITGSIATKPKS